jgi:hypothetical protein
MPPEINKKQRKAFALPHKQPCAARIITSKSIDRNETVLILRMSANHLCQRSRLEARANKIIKQ